MLPKVCGLGMGLGVRDRASFLGSLMSSCRVIMPVLISIATHLTCDGGAMDLQRFGHLSNGRTLASFVCHDYPITFSKVLIRLFRHGVLLFYNRKIKEYPDQRFLPIKPKISLPIAPRAGGVFLSAGASFHTPPAHHLVQYQLHKLPFVPKVHLIMDARVNASLYFMSRA